MFSDLAFSKHLRADGVTWNEKGETVNARDFQIIDTTPPKNFSVVFGDHFETLTLTWRGKVKTISMKDVWEAL